MYAVLVAVLPILIVALVVAIVRITTVAVIAVAVFVALLIVGKPLFAVPGTISPLAVRTTAIILFAAVFAIFVALLIGGTVFLIGR